MQEVLDKLCRLSLKKAYRLDLVKTRQEYNELGAILFTGAGITAISILLALPDFPFKPFMYFLAFYSFVPPLTRKFTPPGYPLWLSVLHVPVGMIEILVIQALFPAELIWLTCFLFPLVFVFTFHFHSMLFSVMSLIGIFVASAFIVEARGMPYWQAYTLMTLGMTISVSIVIRVGVNRILGLANYDYLTGLMNRGYWEAMLQQLIAVSEREKSPLSLVFFDVDNFKHVNDRLGHAAGDEVLKQVAQRVTAVSRDADCLARWGGDEFVLALPNTDIAQAEALSSRLQKDMGEIQISVGVVMHQSGESAQSFLDRADKAMYRVKNAKRGVSQVVMTLV